MDSIINLTNEWFMGDLETALEVSGSESLKATGDSTAFASFFFGGIDGTPDTTATSEDINSTSSADSDSEASSASASPLKKSTEHLNLFELGNTENNSSESSPASDSATPSKIDKVASETVISTMRRSLGHINLLGPITQVPSFAKKN